MTNFCPKCGKKVNQDDIFCKNCGANLIESAEVSKVELMPEKPPAPIQIPSKPSPILKIIGLGVGLFTLYLILTGRFYSGSIGIIILIVTIILIKRKKSKIESKPEKTPTFVQVPTPAPIQIPSRPSGPPIIIEIIKAGIQLLVWGLILYLIWYSYCCATGKYPNTQDRMCQSIYQAFKGGGGTSGGGGGGGTTGGGGSKVSIGCQHCSPGYCYGEGHCCPSSAQYYCNGYCYRSSGEAYHAGCHQSGWTRYCCY